MTHLSYVGLAGWDSVLVSDAVTQLDLSLNHVALGLLPSVFSEHLVIL